jgi:uncharacterized membrane protein YagU involved in acid resistance
MRGVVRAIIIGGFLAGTLDIGAASLINQVSPLIILRVIARGLLGKSAMQGGLPVSALGMGLQWTMSLLIAAIYALGTRWAAVFDRLWVLSGLAFGVGVFVVMEFVVVPLSAIGHAPHFTALSLAENLTAMLVFGLIIAWSTRRWAARPA